MTDQDRQHTRILVVDDEKSARDILNDLLTTLGFSVTVKSSGEEAIREIRTQHYDLLLTDLLMPGMDGLDVVRNVKAISPDTMTIVVTAQGSLQTAVESIRNGAFDYLTKPFSLDTLEVRILKALEYRNLIEDSEEYRRRATIDALTGLHNFAYFHEVLQTTIEQARRYNYPVSLLMIDMDDLKVYNDQLGHMAGNRVLMKIGQIFNSSTRKADIACRYGGEEFAIILPHTEKQYALFLCDRLRAAVEATTFEGEEVMPHGHITVSSGVATFPVDALSADELVERADRALYAAKRGGKNQVFLYSDTVR